MWEDRANSVGIASVSQPVHRGQDGTAWVGPPTVALAGATEGLCCIDGLPGAGLPAPTLPGPTNLSRFLVEASRTERFQLKTTPEDELFQFRGGERWRCPWPAYQTLRDNAPAHRHFDEEHGEFWVLSRFDDVFEAARDTAAFSSAKGLTPDPASMAMFEGRASPIVMMDPPEHTSMRRLVSRPMTPRAVSTIGPAVRDFIDDRLKRLHSFGVTQRHGFAGAPQRSQTVHSLLQKETHKLPCSPGAKRTIVVESCDRGSEYSA